MATLELKLDPKTGTYGPAFAEVLDGKGGELEAIGIGGAVRQVADFELLDVPLGKAIVGGSIAGLADAVLHYVEPMIPRTGLISGPQRRAILMFLGAAGVQWGPIKKFLSSQGADAASFVLALDALVTVFNARSIVGSLLEKALPKGFSHRAGGTTLAAQQGRRSRSTAAFVNSPTLTPARALHLGV